MGEYTENLKKGKATQFKAGKKQAEIARKGGKASGKAKAEKKMFKQILDELLDMPISDNAQIEKIAKKYGVDKAETVKSLFAVASLMNTLKKGKLSDIIEAAAFLGEIDTDKNKDTLDKLDEVIKTIKEETEK